MAYEDLTPQERQALQQSLLAAPPPSLAAPSAFTVDPLTRAQASAGLLGSAGRFIEQLARQQDEAALQTQANRMAQEIQGIPPLDPDYLGKVQKIASANPTIFRSGAVQEALQLGDMARKVEEQRADATQAGRSTQLAEAILEAPRRGFTDFLTEAAKADVNAFDSPVVQKAITVRNQEIAAIKEKRERKTKTAAERLRTRITTATPEQLDKLQAEAPQYLPDIEKRREELVGIEDVASQLPYTLRKPENLTRLQKAKSALNQFNHSLPAPLAKVQSYAQRKAAAEAADAYVKASKALPPDAAKEDKEAAARVDDLRRLAIAELDMDPDKGLPDETLERIAKTRDLFKEETDYFREEDREALKTQFKAKGSAGLAESLATERLRRQPPTIAESQGF
jgi:hypothetical protein